MADITNKNIAVPGVNSPANFVRQYSYQLDFVNASEVAATGTHDLQKLPAGESLIGLKVIVIDAVTSGGAGTLQFKVKVGTASTAIHSSAIALAGVAKGFVHNLNVSGVLATGENILQLTVGTAALTGGKLLIIAETVPTESFITAG